MGIDSRDGQRAGGSAKEVYGGMMGWYIGQPFGVFL